VDVEFRGRHEAKVVDGLVDAIVEVTETGSTLRAHNLRVVQEMMTTNPQLIANKAAWQDPGSAPRLNRCAVTQGCSQAEMMWVLN